MKKILRVLLGMVLGIFIFMLFLFFGGAEYLKKFGQRTEEAGVKLERYEKDLKEAVEKAKERAVETGEKTEEKVIETYEGTKEKVKEYMPD